MKTKFTIVMALIASCITNLNAQWVNAVSGTTNDLYTIAFSGNTGVAAGRNGTALHTTNAGISWTDSAYHNYDPIKSSAFSSPTNVAMGTDGHYYHSSNGGATFTGPTTASGLGILQAITFTSSTVGIAIDDACRIANTTDGGQTWTVGAHPCTAYPVMNDINFPTSTTGYVCGENGSIYKTTDGGSTWSATTAPGANNVKYFAVQFLNASTGYLTGYINTSADTFLLKKTIDGGSSWINLEPGLLSLGVSYLSQISSLSFANQNLGYLTIANKIYKTTDGGSSWALDYTSTVDDGFGNKYVFNKILASPNVVLAVGDGGLMARAPGNGTSTGVGEVKMPENISVYPNPSSNNITLGSFLINNDGGFLQITDAGGRIVKAEKINSNQVDISLLANGNYLGQLTGSNNSKYVFKFVKQ